MDQFLDPETDIMDQFLGPETDIMGEGNFMIFFKTFICIFSISIQVKYTCFIFNLQPRDAISYFDDYCQVELQLGGVQFWSRCFR